MFKKLKKIWMEFICSRKEINFLSRSLLAEQYRNEQLEQEQIELVSKYTAMALSYNRLSSHQK